MIKRMLEDQGKCMVVLVDVQGRVLILDFDAIRRIDVRDGDGYRGTNIELKDESIFVIDDHIETVVRELYPRNYRDFDRVFQQAKQVRDRWLWEQERAKGVSDES